MRSPLGAQPNRSLIDGIATLQALASSPEPVGCREIARQLGLDPTKVNRLLKTLTYLGIARQTANRKYTAGSGMHVLFHAPPGPEVSRGLGRIGLLPATTSGIGIVLLAELEDAHVTEIYAGKEIPRYPQGIEQLLDKLREVRELGYARIHVDDERNFDVVAVSTGEPAHAGLALSGWIPEGATAPLVEALRQAATEIG